MARWGGAIVESEMFRICPINPTFFRLISVPSSGSVLLVPLYSPILWGNGWGNLAMPASTEPKSLTAAFVSSVKEPGKYHDGKGTGLFLLVKSSGARSWVQ